MYNLHIYEREDLTPVRKLLMMKAIAGGTPISEYTETGNPVSFDTNVAKPLSECLLSFLPVQSGTGDPSPDNVRPVTGWTAAKAYRTGVNVWDEETELGGINSSTGQEYSSTNAIRSKNYIPVVPGASYYLKAPSMTGFTGCWYDKDKNRISTRYQVNAVMTAPDNAYFFRFGLPSSYGATYGNDISINYPSTDTEYHAYSGSYVSVSFPAEAGTVYGGTHDLVTGVLTDEWYGVDASSLKWIDTSATSVFGALIPYARDVSSATNIVCDSYKTVSAAMDFSDMPDNSIKGYSNEDFAVVYIKDSRYTTKEDFAENVDAFFVYQRATPRVYQLTPEEILSLANQTNVLWSDLNGDLTVTYKKKG